MPASVPRRGHLPCIAAQINPTNHHTATHSHTQPHTATHKSTHSHTQPHTATHKSTRIGGAHSRSPRMCVNPQSNPRWRGSQPLAPNVCHRWFVPLIVVAGGSVGFIVTASGAVASCRLAAARLSSRASPLLLLCRRGCWWQRFLNHPTLPPAISHSADRRPMVGGLPSAIWRQASRPTSHNAPRRRTRQRFLPRTSAPGYRLQPTGNPQTHKAALHPQNSPHPPYPPRKPPAGSLGF